MRGVPPKLQKVRFWAGFLHFEDVVFEFSTRDSAAVLGCIEAAALRWVRVLENPNVSAEIRSLLLTDNPITKDGSQALSQALQARGACPAMEEICRASACGTLEVIFDTHLHRYREDRAPLVAGTVRSRAAAIAAMGGASPAIAERAIEAEETESSRSRSSR